MAVGDRWGDDMQRGIMGGKSKTDDEDILQYFFFFLSLPVVVSIRFARKGHATQLDTLSNSVAHMHAETRHAE